MATVFVSYRQENDAHSARVRAFAGELRRLGAPHGLTVILDCFANEEQFHGGGPPEGWPRWSIDRANESIKVIGFGSPGWFRSYQGKEAGVAGLGCAAEARIIQQRIYNGHGINHFFRVVLHSAGEACEIPMELQSYHQFSFPGDLSSLLTWLIGQPVPPVASVTGRTGGFPANPPAIAWPFCDYEPVRSAFATLLTAGSEKRIMRIEGPSGTGKSEITRHLLGQGLRLDGLAVGRFDFKSGTDLSAEFDRFVPELGVDTAVAGSQGRPLLDRLEAALVAMKQNKHPTLLLFDTFELAGVYGRWLEERALVAAVRASWLRIVVVGQRVPDSATAPWAGVALPVQPLTPLPWHEWHRYGAFHRPGRYDESFVQKLHEGVGGNHATMRVVLGPTS